MPAAVGAMTDLTTPDAAALTLSRFLVSDIRAARARVEEAKKVCRRCPVGVHA